MNDDEENAKSTTFHSLSLCYWKISKHRMMSSALISFSSLHINTQTYTFHCRVVRKQIRDKWKIGPDVRNIYELFMNQDRLLRSIQQIWQRGWKLMRCSNFWDRGQNRIFALLKGRIKSERRIFLFVASSPLTCVSLTLMCMR